MKGKTLRTKKTCYCEVSKRDRNAAWGIDCVQQIFTALKLIAQHIPFIFQTYTFTAWRTKTKHYANPRGTFLDIYWRQLSGFMLIKPHRAMWWVAANTAYKCFTTKLEQVSHLHLLPNAFILVFNLMWLDFNELTAT